MKRKAKITRKTKETKIDVEINKNEEITIPINFILPPLIINLLKGTIAGNKDKN